MPIIFNNFLNISIMKIKFRILLLSFSLFLGVAEAQVNVVAHTSSANHSSPAWIKLGTLTIPQGGYTAVIKVSGGAGFAAGIREMGTIEINFRTSNGDITQNGFAFVAYAFQTGYAKLLPQLKFCLMRRAN
jgi:hypothetical protein